MCKFYLTQELASSALADSSVTKAKLLFHQLARLAPTEPFADHYIGRRRLEAVAEILADVATMLRT